MKTFNYGVDYLTPAIALQIVHGEIKGSFNEKSLKQINSSSKDIDDIIKSDKTLYGVNTGFGPLCTTIISKEETTHLQVNILKSHSVGIGDAVSIEIAKLMLILKIHALSFGYSGIKLATLKHIQILLNKNIIPVVPEQGSVGASGDLAPLAHLFLPLIGLGEVFYNGKIHKTAHVYKKKK